MTWKPVFLLMLMLLCSAVTCAQSASTPQAKVNIIIDREAVRFAPQEAAQELRLLVTDQAGVELYDSGLLSVTTLDWPLRDSQGVAVKGGLYLYTLTVKAVAGEISQRRGYVIVNRAGETDRVWVATSDKVGIGAGSEVSQVTVVGSSDATVGGAELPSTVPRRETGAERPDSPQRLSTESVAKKPDTPAVVNGTNNRLAKFGFDGESLADTQVSETNGALVVGNAGAVGNIQIFGQANQDVFAGMGPDVVNGPAFNYGYAGSSFGRSAGFFNVRPDASAVAPNPSLRFLTANQQRMIITNTGNVGIGTTVPNTKLTVWTPSATGIQEGLRINNPVGFVGNNGSSLVFSQDRSPAENFVNATIEGVQELTNSSADGYLAFSTRSASAVTERMRITSTGNVGIGTTTPSLGKLQVEASGGVAVRGISSSSTGVDGRSDGGSAVSGISQSGYGVFGKSTNESGVFGYSVNYIGVVAQSDTGTLIAGYNSTPTGPKFRVANDGTVHAPGYQALPDFAEEILPSPLDKSRLEPGDVLVAASDTDRSVSRSRKPYSTSVLGVYSTAPGFIGTEHPLEGASSETIPMAVIGIVPCKVSAENGPIRRGDLLTTSRTPGHAMRCVDRRKCIGAIVGKALATLDRGTGVIKVLVTLQ